MGTGTVQVVSDLLLMNSFPKYMLYVIEWAWTENQLRLKLHVIQCVLGLQYLACYLCAIYMYFCVHVPVCDLCSLMLKLFPYAKPLCCNCCCSHDFMESILAHFSFTTQLQLLSFIFS